MSYECFVENGVGVVRLNRPDKLNALDLSMIHGVTTALTNWQADENVHWILLEGKGPAFCAGGDVFGLRDTEHVEEALSYFEDEFALDLMLHHYPKPVVVHYKGASMGGGIGLGGNADLRICDETTIWAMPESRLGFPPDVGVGYFISKLPRAEALYLTLTAGRLRGEDLLGLDLADMYIHSSVWPALREALIAHPSALVPPQELAGSLAKIASTFATPPDPHTAHAAKRPYIEKYFNEPTLLGIVRALEAGDDDFARESLQSLRSAAPLTLSVIFAKYDADRGLTRRDILRRDHFFLGYFFENRTLQEGIRVTMIDKDDQGHFHPARIEDVPDGLVAELLAKSLSDPS